MSISLCLRPLVVRFTDTHRDDEHIDLVYERGAGHWPSLHQETVGELKQALRMHDARRRGRRLRLILFGQVLSNATKLASFLDSSAQIRERDQEEATCEHILLEKRSYSASQYTLHPIISDAPNIRSWGKQRAEQVRDESTFPLSNSGGVDVLRLSTVYLQCSLGSEDSNNADEEDSHPILSTTSEPRGFDRLRYTAGMSALDVQVMREHFHQRSGVSLMRSGDLLRRQEEDELAYTLEEQWIDNMDETPEALIQSRRASPQSSALKGLLIGFFLPILPLFLAQDEAQPIDWPPPPSPEQEQQMEQLWGVARILSDFRNRPPQATQEDGDAQLREEAQQTATLLTNLLNVRQAQGTRADPNSDDSDDEDAPNPSVRRLTRQDRYGLFAPYTYFAVLVGLSINALLGGLRMLL
ncbi:hypothetical protein MYAM1_001020 [Malassezia yamatoensis]|uniref:Ubiquitin-like domain-containing protein n=1 Tax=Malassezia yamatoensis TaxID=253288 RepID=A0AAJ5YQK0_9BASI|nr:hypothetical protein MYAM1_001020 [Malassezia yamatoensis]